MTLANDHPTITIRDGSCAECGAGMVADNGLCLKCTGNAISGKKMRSKTGRAVQKRSRSELRKTRMESAQTTSPGKGHNTGTTAAVKDEQTAHRFAKDQLKSYVERVEHLEEEKKNISDDIRDVYAEAKGNGFDVKSLRTVVRMRKQDAAERKEHEAILETYLHALGMLS